MNIDDLILVSVDDHVIEPAHMFEGRVPKKYQAEAPRFITPRRRHDGLAVRRPGNRSTSALNAVAGRPPEEYGIEPTSFDQIRSGCYDIDERVKDMDANGVLGSLCFPSFPQFCGQLFARTEDKDLAAGAGAGLQRLAHRRLVRHPSGPLHPLAAAGDLGSRGAGRRVRRTAAKGCHAVTFSREPLEARAGRASTPTTGIRSGRPAATRTSSSACTSARRRRPVDHVSGRPDRLV